MRKPFRTINLTNGAKVPASGTYADESDRPREVAAYIKTGSGLAYINRGTWREVLPAMTPRAGWSGGLSSFNADELRFVIDQPAYPSALDRLTLAWTGPLLTLAQFREWVHMMQRPHGPDDYGEGAPECDACEGEGTADGVSDCAPCGGRGRMGTP